MTKKARRRRMFAEAALASGLSVLSQLLSLFAGPPVSFPEFVLTILGAVLLVKGFK